MTNLLYSENFLGGISSCWTVQALTNGITVVDNPLGSGKALRADVQYALDYSGLVSGTPRAEIYHNKILLKNEQFYIIKLKTYLPSDYQIESGTSNPCSLMQIHQNVSYGAPQFSLGINANVYRITSNYDNYATAQNYAETIQSFGTVSSDLGKWVSWEIHYKPSYSVNGRAVVYKDGVKVIDFTGRCAYDGIDGYIKLGIYKSAWKTSSTSTTEITEYFTDIEIYEGVKMKTKYDALLETEREADINITSGTDAPTSTPKAIGDVYIDTAAVKFYRANGTSSSADWKLLNGSSIIPFGCTSKSSPVDATQYNVGCYYGSAPIVTGSGENTVRIYIPRSGVITKCYFTVIGDPSATNETGTVSIRVNNATDNTVSSSVTFNAYQSYYNNTSLNIPVTEGNYIWVKVLTPTWATNPNILGILGQIELDY